MSNTPKTLAAILAEMRAEQRPYGISNDCLRFYADRIEAVLRQNSDCVRWALAKSVWALAAASGPFCLVEPSHGAMCRTCPRARQCQASKMCVKAMEKIG